MKKSLKTKPLKITKGSELPPEPLKPPESHPHAQYNPIVLLRYHGKDIFKIDLWALAMLYAPKEAMENWNSLSLFLDEKEVKNTTR